MPRSRVLGCDLDGKHRCELDMGAGSQMAARGGRTGCSQTQCPRQGSRLLSSEVSMDCRSERGNDNREGENTKWISIIENVGFPSK